MFARDARKHLETLFPASSNAETRLSLRYRVLRRTTERTRHLFQIVSESCQAPNDLELIFSTRRPDGVAPPPLRDGILSGESSGGAHF